MHGPWSDSELELPITRRQPAYPRLRWPEIVCRRPSPWRTTADQISYFAKHFLQKLTFPVVDESLEELQAVHGQLQREGHVEAVNVHVAVVHVVQMCSQLQLLGGGGS